MAWCSPTSAEEADVLLLNTCSVREKPQEKVFSQLGRWRPWKRTQSRAGHRRRRLRGQPGGRRHHRARALRGPGLRSPDPAPPAGDDRRGAPHRATRWWTSPSPRSRSSTACRSRAPTAPPPSSPSWKAAPSTAPSAWCPTRAAKRSAGPSTTCIAEVAQLAAQGVREVNLLGQNVNAYRGRAWTTARSPTWHC